MSATTNTYVSPNLAATPDAPDIFVSKHTLHTRYCLPFEIVIMSDDMVARFCPFGAASLIGTPLSGPEFDLALNLALRELCRYEGVPEMLRVLPGFFQDVIKAYSKLVAERDADDVRIFTLRDCFKRDLIKRGHSPEHALKLADDHLFCAF